MKALREILKWQLFNMLPKLPRKLSDDPARHSDYDIGWSLQDGWRRLVRQHVRSQGPDILSGQARDLERSRIRVVFVKRMGSSQAIAFARPSPGLGRLPDVALGLMLGVPEGLARRVDQAIRREDSDLLTPEHATAGNSINTEMTDRLRRRTSHRMEHRRLKTADASCEAPLSPGS